MKNILVIYTGGTIGMVKDKITGSLHPFDMKKIYEALPVLKELECNIDTLQFDPIIDSSDMNAEVWIRLAGVIGQKYEDYDGFVVLFPLNSLFSKNIHTSPMATSSLAAISIAEIMFSLPSVLIIPRGNWLPVMITGFARFSNKKLKAEAV